MNRYPSYPDIVSRASPVIHIWPEIIVIVLNLIRHVKGAGRVVQLLVHAIVQGVETVHDPMTTPPTKQVTHLALLTEGTHPRAGAMSSSEGAPNPIELPEERVGIRLPLVPKHPLFKVLRALARRALFCEAAFGANKHVLKNRIAETF